MQENGYECVWAKTTPIRGKISTYPLRQQLPLVVAVAQLAIARTAPAPDGAVGGEGDAVAVCCRHSDDAPVSQGLDLLRQ